MTGVGAAASTGFGSNTSPTPSCACMRSTCCRIAPSRASSVSWKEPSGRWLAISTRHAGTVRSSSAYQPRIAFGSVRGRTMPAAARAASTASSRDQRHSARSKRGAAVQPVAAGPTVPPSGPACSRPRRLKTGTPSFVTATSVCSMPSIVVAAVRERSAPAPWRSEAAIAVRGPRSSVHGSSEARRARAASCRWAAGSAGGVADACCGAGAAGPPPSAGSRAGAGPAIAPGGGPEAPGAAASKGSPGVGAVVTRRTRSRIAANHHSRRRRVRTEPMVEQRFGACQRKKRAAARTQLRATPNMGGARPRSVATSGRAPPRRSGPRPAASASPRTSRRPRAAAASRRRRRGPGTSRCRCCSGPRARCRSRRSRR